MPKKRKHQNPITETSGRKSEAIRRVDIPARIEIPIPKKRKSKIYSEPSIQNPKRLIRKENPTKNAIDPTRSIPRERAKRQNKRSPMIVYIVIKKLPPEKIIIRRIIYHPESIGRIDSFILYASTKSAVIDRNIPIPIV